MYLSLGRCLPTWPVTGQSLRTLPYCTPRGLETGHQRLKEEDEEYRRREEAARAKKREGIVRKEKGDRKGGEEKGEGEKREGGRVERGSKVI